MRGPGGWVTVFQGRHPLPSLAPVGPGRVEGALPPGGSGATSGAAPALLAPGLAERRPPYQRFARVRPAARVRRKGRQDLTGLRALVGVEAVQDPGDLLPAVEVL